jgi:hypothetical protein
MTLHSFAHWLSQTQASAVIQDVNWIIPTTQSIHILSIAIVMSSVFMVDLRLLKVLGRGQPTADYTSRYLPWIWPTLVVLLVTGSILITAEPARSLLNPSFQLKMVLLVLAMIVTAVLQGRAAKDPNYWETSGREGVAKLLAVVSIVLWIGILFAGRWIAYMNISGD